MNEPNNCPSPPPSQSPPPSSGKPPYRPPRSNSIFFLLLILLLVVMAIYYSSDQGKSSGISYGLLQQELDKNNIEKVDVQNLRITGEFKDPPLDPDAKPNTKKKLDKKFHSTISPLVDNKKLDRLLLEKLGKNYTATEPNDSTFVVLAVYIFLFMALLVGLWFMFRRARESIFSGGIMGGFSKSGARRYEAGDNRVTFGDVAGLEGVKNDLAEVVEFLKNPQKFQRLGARVPKGILLMGPPGTGKTLLGRAVAGEAGVPFFSINGSEFIQMFVGVGAGRVRDLFTTAKETSPSIIFIDEIDAVGRHRGAGVGGGHDEREQTLNQILSEMDGFSQTDAVIVMAATNRPDVLDPALLRPGRFDRHITVDRPNYKGRLAIFKVHSKEVPLNADVDLERLAAGTVGLTGADIRNLVNEAALWASRNGKDSVAMEDFEYARDKVLMGSKRDDVLLGKEKSMTAYHESGHALLAWLLPTTDRVHKVSIIPRGRALGVTQLLPEEDKVNISEKELRVRLVFLLGGREAEKLVFNELSAGAEDDLNKATQIARRMITHWGMSERLGPVAFRDSEDHPFLGKEMAEPRRYSENTAQIIDEEILRLLNEASEIAQKTLSEQRDKLDKLSKALEESETLDEKDIEELIGPPAYNTDRKETDEMRP
jgi:cell division protease FtsH